MNVGFGLDYNNKELVKSVSKNNVKLFQFVGNCSYKEVKNDKLKKSKSLGVVFKIKDNFNQTYYKVVNDKGCFMRKTPLSCVEFFDKLLLREKKKLIKELLEIK